MRNAQAIKKHESTAINATKHVAKIITAIVMLIATAAVIYIAS